ncbi:IS5/IS1182 family transposase [Streptomyces sp. PRh5]|uniref:IS5/IS1182 family transposase n=1 Tax=Streptomyces sp. PRh5 TaxID=1158056 RepID=UPI0004BCD0CA|nr:IS5/IS1182 family transposase [Streptomyces sp. PRh5]
MRYYFEMWKRDGLDARINDALRMMVREKAGRAADPSLVVLDSQSVCAAAGVSKATTGLDAAKKTPGRRRGLAVDVIGLIIAVVVVAAPVHDNAIGTALPNKVAPVGTVRTALVDQGFKASVVEHGRTLGIDVQIVARDPGGEYADLDLERPPTPALPDGAAYQQIMDVFEHERRPLRARDLCLALDLPLMPKRLEGTRA